MNGKTKTKIILKFLEKTRYWCHRAVIEAYQKMMESGTDYHEWEEEDISKALYEKMKRLDLVRNKEITIIPEFRLYGAKYSKKKAKAKEADRIDFLFSRWKLNVELEYFGEAKNLSSKTWTKSHNEATVDASYYGGRYIDTGIKHLTSGSYALLNGFLIGYIVNGSAKENLDSLNSLIIKRKLPPKIGLIENPKPICSYPACYTSKNIEKKEEVILQHIFLEFDK